MPQLASRVSSAHGGCLKKKFGSRYPGARGITVRYTRLSATTIKYRISWIKHGTRYAGSVKIQESDTATNNNYTYWLNVHRR
jgi:hypothetical protein